MAPRRIISWSSGRSPAERHGTPSACFDIFPARLDHGSDRPWACHSAGGATACCLNPWKAFQAAAPGPGRPVNDAETELGPHDSPNHQSSDNCRRRQNSMGKSGMTPVTGRSSRRRGAVHPGQHRLCEGWPTCWCCTGARACTGTFGGCRQKWTAERSTEQASPNFRDHL